MSKITDYLKKKTPSIYDPIIDKRTKSGYKTPNRLASAVKQKEGIEEMNNKALRYLGLNENVERYCEQCKSIQKHEEYPGPAKYWPGTYVYGNPTHVPKNKTGYECKKCGNISIKPVNEADKKEYEDVYSTARDEHLKNVNQTDKDYADKKLTKDEYHAKMIEHGKAFHAALDASTSPERQKVIDDVTRERGKNS